MLRRELKQHGSIVHGVKTKINNFALEIVIPEEVYQTVRTLILSHSNYKIDRAISG